MFLEHQITTGDPGLYEITEQIRAAVQDSGITDGLCVVFSPDTDTAVLITSFWDVRGHEDIIDDYRTVFPAHVDYLWQGDPHTAAAHAKSAVTGTSLDVIIQNGVPLLGDSQGVYLADFTGSKTRSCHIGCI